MFGTIRNTLKTIGKKQNLTGPIKNTRLHPCTCHNILLGGLWYIRHAEVFCRLSSKVKRHCIRSYCITSCVNRLLISLDAIFSPVSLHPFWYIGCHSKPLQGYLAFSYRVPISVLLLEKCDWLFLWWFLVSHTSWQTISTCEKKKHTEVKVDRCWVLPAHKGSVRLTWWVFQEVKQ